MGLQATARNPGLHRYRNALITCVPSIDGNWFPFNCYCHQFPLIDGNRFLQPLVLHVVIWNVGLELLLEADFNERLFFLVISLVRVAMMKRHLLTEGETSHVHSTGRSASRPAPRAAPVRNPPQPAYHAPPPAPVQQGGGGSMLGGIGSTIAQGMAFGTGSAIAHRAVDAVVGPRTVQHEAVPAEASAAQSSYPPMSNLNGPDACGSQSKAFQDCLNNYGSDISKCQFYLDMLSECRRGSSASVNL